MGSFKNGFRTGFGSLTSYGSKTVYAFGEATKSHRRKIAIGGGVLVALVAVGGYFLFQHMGAQAVERANGSWTSFHRCLIGEPLGKDEPASVRFRAVQLAGMTQSEVHRSKAGANPWPERCSQHAFELREALTDASKVEEGKKDAGFWLEKLGTALKDAGLAADIGEPLDTTWAEVAKLGLVLGAGSADAPKPPAAMTGQTVDTMKSMSPIAKTPLDLRTLQVEFDPGTNLKLLVEDKQGTDPVLLCMMNDGSSPLRCAPPSSEIRGQELGMRLLGTSDDGADPLVFVGNRGSQGVHRTVSGEKIEAGVSLGGYASKDGFSAMLTWDEGTKRLTLVRKESGKPSISTQIAPEAKVKVQSPSRDARLLWSHALMRGANRFKETWLVAQEVSRGPVPGALTDVGLLAEAGSTVREGESLPISGCKNSKTTVARIRGDANEFITFLVDGKWTKPLKADGTGGTLSCRGAEGWITRVEQVGGESMLQAVITQSRCTPAACRSDRLKLSEMMASEPLLAPVAEFAAGELSGKLIVVWRGGERGGLRMRIGPMRSIAQERDTLLYDDLIKEGRMQATSTLSDFRLFTREGFGLVVLSTSAGTYGMVINSEGQVTPLKVE